MKVLIINITIVSGKEKNKKEDRTDKTIELQLSDWPQ
jgi:hypothetical protein